MAILDFISAAQATVLSSPSYLALALVSLLVPLVIRLADRPQFKNLSPKVISGNLPVIGAYGFFSKRWDFFHEQASKSASGNFSFHAGKHPLIGVSGDANRRIFFHDQKLDFNAGYEVLFDVGPKVEEVTADEKLGTRGFGHFFRRSIKTVLRQERLRAKKDILFKATREGLDALGSSGRMEPFEDIYNLVYRLTMLMVGCNEIANDRDLLDKSLRLFKTIDDSSTPASIIAPWAPLPAFLWRNLAGARLYMMFDKFVKDRKKTQRREEDTLQILMDEGVDTANILKFILGSVFAGLLNTGINSAAIIGYLGCNPEWRKRCLNDVRRVCTEKGCDTSRPLIDQLAELPIEVWEQGFPMIDLCMKESMRLQLLGSFFRRNISGKDVALTQHGGRQEIVPPGAFAIYHVSDIHHNPEVYPNPMEYDPGRYLPGREEHLKVPHGWVGWGAGLHPCLGIRTAKLEIMIIVAQFVALFDWNLLDGDGKDLARMPDPDLNSHSATKPKEKLVVEFERTEKC